MPKVFNFPKLVLWCAKRFDTGQRIILVQEVELSPIHLNPFVFKKKLRLLKPNQELNLREENTYLANNGGL
jgi:hypothetical protein